MASSSSSPSPIDAPEHVLGLLAPLHMTSLEQEATMSSTGKVMSTTVHDDLEERRPDGSVRDAFDKLMLDKFIALDEDKCQFVYQSINAMGATDVIEAGTSYGVSTIYLALAVAKVKKALGREGTVNATEKQERKAEVVRTYWRKCGDDVEGQIDLKVGDLVGMER